MVNIRMKKRDVKLKHIHNQHYWNIETDYQIMFDKMITMVTITSYSPRKYRETIKI